MCFTHKALFLDIWSVLKESTTKRQEFVLLSLWKSILAHSSLKAVVPADTVSQNMDVLVNISVSLSLHALSLSTSFYYHLSFSFPILSQAALVSHGIETLEFCPLAFSFTFLLLPTLFFTFSPFTQLVFLSPNSSYHFYQSAGFFSVRIAIFQLSTYRQLYLHTIETNCSLCKSCVKANQQLISLL